MSVEPDRARGVLLGLACGDALGRPVEGWPAGAIEREYGRLDEMVGQGAHRLPAGSITDDTEMALCLARSLADRGAFDPDDVADRFVDWYESGPTGIGGMTRRVLDRVARGQEWETASEAVWESSPEGRNAGNGSVMRCAPLTVALADDPDQLAAASRTSSRITHVDSRCTSKSNPRTREDARVRGFDFEGCAVLNLTIADLLTDRPPREALDAALDRTDPPGELRDALVPVPGRDRASLEVTGYVVHTLATALQVGLSADGTREGIVEAITLGGDTHTIGAVAGAFAGARFGASGLPGDWLDTLQARAELESLADELAR